MTHSYFTVDPWPHQQDGEAIIERTIRICRACYDLKGDMCHNPECVFCRRTMSEVRELLDQLQICPVIEGVRHQL